MKNLLTVLVIALTSIALSAQTTTADVKEDFKTDKFTGVTTGDRFLDTEVLFFEGARSTLYTAIHEVVLQDTSCYAMQMNYRCQNKKGKGVKVKVGMDVTLLTESGPVKGRVYKVTKHKVNDSKIGQIAGKYVSMDFKVDLVSQNFLVKFDSEGWETLASSDVTDIRFGHATAGAHIDHEIPEKGRSVIQEHLLALGYEVETVDASLESEAAQEENPLTVKID
jgi:hypothetical protein